MGSIPGLTEWAKDPALLWLWLWLAAAVPIQTLAGEHPYAKGEALKKTPPPQKKRERELKIRIRSSCHGSVETNPTRNHEVLGLIPGLTPWVKDPAFSWAVV